MNQWLDVFEKAKQGDEHLRSVLERFERLICARRDHDRMARIVDDSLVRPVPSPLPPTLRKPEIFIVLEPSSYQPPHFHSQHY
jgi:hypothetical protein